MAESSGQRQAGRLVSTDPNWRAHLWEDPREAEHQLERLLGSADIVKISDDELGPLVGTTDVEAAGAALFERGVKLAVITLGARGCWFRARGGSGYLPGERGTVVDTTGAGDAFTAGLLAALAPALVAGRTLDTLTGDELRGACARANRLGAQAATALGATAAIDRRPML